MEKIFDYPSPQEHYHNHEAFLWCSDQRFEEVRRAFAKGRKISYAGPDPFAGRRKAARHSCQSARSGIRLGTDQSAYGAWFHDALCHGA